MLGSNSAGESVLLLTLDVTRLVVSVALSPGSLGILQG